MHKRTVHRFWILLNIISAYFGFILQSCPVGASCSSALVLLYLHILALLEAWAQLQLPCCCVANTRKNMSAASILHCFWHAKMDVQQQLGSNIRNWYQHGLEGLRPRVASPWRIFWCSSDILRIRPVCTVSPNNNPVNAFSYIVFSLGNNIPVRGTFLDTSHLTPSSKRSSVNYIVTLVFLYLCCFRRARHGACVLETCI